MFVAFVDPSKPTKEPVSTRIPEALSPTTSESTRESEVLKPTTGNSTRESEVLILQQVRAQGNHNYSYYNRSTRESEVFVLQQEY